MNMFYIYIRVYTSKILPVVRIYSYKHSVVRFMIYFTKAIELQLATETPQISEDSYTINLNAASPLEPNFVAIKWWKILRAWKNSDSLPYKTVRSSLKSVQPANFIDYICWGIEETEIRSLYSCGEKHKIWARSKFWRNCWLRIASALSFCMSVSK